MFYRDHIFFIFLSLISHSYIFPSDPKENSDVEYITIQNEGGLGALPKSPEVDPKYPYCNQDEDNSNVGSSVGSSVINLLSDLTRNDQPDIHKLRSQKRMADFKASLQKYGEHTTAQFFPDLYEEYMRKKNPIPSGFESAPAKTSAQTRVEVKKPQQIKQTPVQANIVSTDVQTPKVEALPKELSSFVEKFILKYEAPTIPGSRTIPIGSISETVSLNTSKGFMIPKVNPLPPLPPLPPSIPTSDNGENTMQAIAGVATSAGVVSAAGAGGGIIAGIKTGAAAVGGTIASIAAGPVGTTVLCVVGGLAAGYLTIQGLQLAESGIKYAWSEFNKGWTQAAEKRIADAVAHRQIHEVVNHPNTAHKKQPAAANSASHPNRPINLMPSDNPLKLGKKIYQPGPKPGQGSNPHGYKDQWGHYRDYTPENVSHAIESVEKGVWHGQHPTNGKHIYTYDCPKTGLQKWAEVDNTGAILNCGINEVPYTVCPVTKEFKAPVGFKKPTGKGRGWVNKSIKAGVIGGALESQYVSSTIHPFIAPEEEILASVSSLPPAPRETTIHDLSAERMIKNHYVAMEQKKIEVIQNKINQSSNL